MLKASLFGCRSFWHSLPSTSKVKRHPSEGQACQAFGNPLKLVWPCLKERGHQLFSLRECLDENPQSAIGIQPYNA